jgi:hypothetical protein
MMYGAAVKGTRSDVLEMNMQSVADLLITAICRSTASVEVEMRGLWNCLA